MLRLFVALDLPEEVRRALREALRALEPVARGFRWVRPERMHLTLAFLGETPETRVPGLQALLKEVAVSEAPFVCEVDGLGSFGRGGTPAVVWAGLSESPPLLALQARLVQRLDAAGFRVDDRPFVPHLTLGRAAPPRPNPRLVAWLRRQARLEPVPLPVERLRLYRSELGPGGPVYTPLATARLGG